MRKNAGIPTFVSDPWFLEELIHTLTRDAEEEIVFITGPTWKRSRIMSRICGFEYGKQSLVYVEGEAKSCADAQIEILERGYQIHAIGHSHPGAGPAATQPSPIDTDALYPLHDRGAKILGIIVTRDGHVRFWTTPTMPKFRVVIRGNGVKKVKGFDHVYRIEVQPADTRSGNEVLRPAAFSV